MKDVLTLALAVATLAFASFVAGRTMGQGEFQPLLNQCERRLDAAQDARAYFRDRRCICEPVTTVYPDAGVITCISADPKGCP